jgi:Protein of unknown function (DUF1552)
MRSYRLARRSFLSAVGGAFGLQILLRDFEAMAAGAAAPPRFLMTHWPVGTLKWAFMPNDGSKPNGVGVISKYSQILQPFADAGLQNDMTLIWGLKDVGATNGGGGHEAGTPMTTTGAACPGTRQNGGEGDDGVAGGPSWDQILLERVVDDAATGAVKLKQPGIGYANAICDARIDSQETSTRCLSYGFQTQSIQSASPGGMITEHVPLLPELKPAQLFSKLFSGFMPGGATPANMATANKALYARKSVLDYCLRELDHLKSVAPAAEAQKIEIHAAACRKIEMQVSDLVNGKVTTVSGCAVPAAPDANLSGKTGSKSDYANPTTSTADDEVHEQIGKIHAGILLAAMQCDLLRVGTFQWSPGTNHVSFKGQYPGEANTIYMHHPLSHKVNSVNTFDSKPSGSNGDIAQFLANVNTWYNARTAMVIKMFKEAIDPLGDGTATMLDRTVIPYVTEVAQQNHKRDPKPAFIFGGKALGMQLGKYISFDGASRNHVDLWATIAQAFFRTNNPMAKLGDLNFASTPAPIDGLWVKPP